MQVNTFLLTLDLVGTFVFALSGAAAGVKHRLDLFGVLVLSFVAANVGGITRDVMIGAVPVAALSDWRYMAVSLLAGLLVFVWPTLLNRLRSPVLVFDAAGLALFAVTGANKALAFGLSPVAAVLLGVLTGVGGGMMRDVLVAQVPNVLRAELYAVAALVGAEAVVIGSLLRLPPATMSIVGAMLCFGLRLIAIRRRWHLPVARVQPSPPTHGPKVPIPPVLINRRGTLNFAHSLKDLGEVHVPHAARIRLVMENLNIHNGVPCSPIAPPTGMHNIPAYALPC